MRFIKFLAKFATENDLKFEDLGISSNDEESEDAHIYIDIERVTSFNETDNGTVTLRLDTGEQYAVYATIEDVYKKITGHE